MRIYLSIAVGAAMLAAALNAGGCVSKPEYDKVMAGNRRLKMSLDKSLAAQRDLAAKNERLDADLAARKRDLDAAQSQLGQLQTDNGQMRTALETAQQTIDRLKGRPTTIVMRQLPPQVDKALTEFAAKHPDLVEYLPKYGMIKLKADLTFALGSDTIKPNAAQALAAFAQVVNSPAAAKFYIYIAGHTDDVRIAKKETRDRHPTNWYLSVHRAVAVQMALSKALVASYRIGVMGFSQYHPIDPNKPGGKGNATNRRVEIWIVPPGRFLTAESGESGADLTPKAPAITK